MWWAGRVGQDAPLDVAFRMARAVDAALFQPQASERRRLLVSAWDAVADVDLLEYAGDLTLLLVTQDAEGASVAGVGLGALWAGDGQGVMRPWLPPGHPMLGVRGLPEKRPGALSLDVLPPLLWALAHGDPEVAPPSQVETLRRGSGVWP